MKRVVVTGIGVVSCLGNNQDEVYKSLLNAKSGITLFAWPELNCVTDTTKVFLGQNF